MMASSVDAQLEKGSSVSKNDSKYRVNTRALLCANPPS
jgi:hypothetical protein